MDTTLTAAIVSGIISAITSFIVTKLMDKSNKKDNIDNELNDILSIAIQYPYLEERIFIKNWDANRNIQNTKHLRYEIYATRVFNYLSRLAKFHRYNPNKIERYIDIKNWLRYHKEYWKNPPDQYENIDGYNEKFKEFINKYIG